MSKPHLIAVLCGPRYRHALFMALADPDETPCTVLRAYVCFEVEHAPISRCPFCRSPRADWIVEETVLDNYETAADAACHVEDIVAEQRFHWTHRN
jgi:hypothetical protein